MKRLFLTLLSTAAVCAVLSATPVAAQETITGAPPGEAPVTAEPPTTLATITFRCRPCRRSDQQRKGDTGCAVLEDSRAEGGHAELTAVCPFIP